jgi:ATP-dependent Clp protease adapter protein ClpS
MSIFRRLRTWYEKNAGAPFVPEGMAYPCLPVAGGLPFAHGIEVINDSVTPMPFILQALQDEAGMPHGDAAIALALCHQRGGVLIPMPSLEDAAETANRIAARAKRESWPLVCQAVSAPPVLADRHGTQSDA